MVSNTPQRTASGSAPSKMSPSFSPSHSTDYQLSEDIDDTSGTQDYYIPDPDARATQVSLGPSSAQDPRFSILDQPQMQMVHFRNLSWSTFNSIHHKPKLKDAQGQLVGDIDFNSELYAKGGCVLWVYMVTNEFTEPKHVMVCNTDVCDVCDPRNSSALTTVPSTDGMPFVHTGDGRDVDGYDPERNLYLLQREHARLYDNARGQHFRPGMIEFKGDHNRSYICPALLCDPQRCQSCKDYPYDLADWVVVYRMGRLEETMDPNLETKSEHRRFTRRQYV